VVCFRSWLEGCCESGERVSPGGVRGGQGYQRAPVGWVWRGRVRQPSHLAMKAPGTISVGLQPGIGAKFSLVPVVTLRTRWRVAECHRRALHAVGRTLQSALEVLGTIDMDPATRLTKMSQKRGAPLENDGRQTLYGGRITGGEDQMHPHYDRADEPNRHRKS